MNKQPSILFTAIAGAIIASSAMAETLSDPFDPANPFPNPISSSAIHVALQPVASGLTNPTFLTHAGDGSGRLFVTDQVGSIHIIANGVLQPQPFVNLASRMVTLRANYDERGLLGLAFHPDFANPASAGYRKLYTYTSEPVGSAADFTVPLPVGISFNHQSVVAEWQADATNPNSVNLSTRREIMRVDEPQSNHNGGMLAFGPDGLLYIGLGDGGRANDTGNGHSATGNGQDTSNVLGDILRIDPLGNNSQNGQYGIPASNPFVNDPSKLDEIYAYGFRNPWRFSFDTQDGKLVVADVGQNKVEEVDIVTAGGNYGWNFKEGQFAFNPVDGSISNDLSGLPPGLLDPVLQYDHDQGISVTGGYVYRGSAMPNLQGKYVFGDWSQSFTAPGGRLFVGDLDNGTIEELVVDGLPSLQMFVLGFGQDPTGELYLLTSTQPGTAGTTGQVFKLTAPVPIPAAVWLFGSALGGIGSLARRKRRGG